MLQVTEMRRPPIQAAILHAAARCALGIALLAAIGCLTAVARGETVRTIDDQTTTGSINGFDAAKSVLHIKPDNKPAVKIPLAEIALVTLRDPIRVAAFTPGQSSNPLGVIGNILGIASAPQPAPQPRRRNRRGGSDNPAGDAATATPNAAVTPRVVNLSHRLVPIWSVEFLGGDRLTASLDKWDADRVRLGLDINRGKPLDVPVVRIRAIWSSNDALVKKAKDLNQTAEAEDVAFVEKDGEVKSVVGVVTGVDAGFLKFKFEGEDHKIKLERIAGILLSQRDVAPERSLFESLTMVNGDVLSGRIESIKRGTLRFKPLFGEENSAHVDIPLAQLATIGVRNGRLTWLGDLKPSGIVQVPYFDRLMPFRVDQSLTGGPLVLVDGPVAKGVAVHTRCTLTYDIAGSNERFRAKVGFQQPEGKTGRAALRIMGDGKVLWQQADLHGDASHPVAVDLNVAHVLSLSLVADYGPTFDVAGRVVWGDARLIKAAH